MNIQKAVLTDGRIIEYVVEDESPNDAVHKSFLAPDRSYVVRFFHHTATAEDPCSVERLQAIVSKYNPTIPESEGGARGNTKTAAAYFKNLFCWPIGIAIQPEVGVVYPTYSSNYFFSSGKLKGEIKTGIWFSSPKLRILVAPAELGPWINYLKICIHLVRAIKRLHRSGLVHSELSPTSILMDPSSGACMVTNIDSLAVPGFPLPDVIGTPGYMAPELVSTLHLPLDDPNRKFPCFETDLHALAVLMYQFLLHRHPLRGPKVYNTPSVEEAERIEMGDQALYIEHPTDQSNRPAELEIPCTVLGPFLEALFKQTFVEGLHTPGERPHTSAMEAALVRTWDMLHTCPNPDCTHKWFVVYNDWDVECPFCKTKIQGMIPVLELRSERRPGQWQADTKLIVYDGLSLFKWHESYNYYPGEECDRKPMGYCSLYKGKWILINQNFTSLTSPGGSQIPPNSAVELKEGVAIRLSQEPSGRMAVVSYINK